jgi:hypothetical protein
MKKLLSILLLFVCQLAQSQTVPQGINYQAVALDQRGQPIPGIDIVGRPIDDAEIGVRIAILENTPTGNILYQEEHEVLTDLYGMFNLVIGQGLQVSVDPFSSINWQGDKFLQVELSIENNGEFVLSAVQQLMSVPYAFLAENAMVAQTAVDVDDADADPSNELQSLTVSGDSLTLSNGNTVQLPALDDADADPNNEIQVLSISNDTLYLSNGGYAVLPVDQVNDADADPSNEIQTLTKSGSTISLTNGGSVTVFDGDYNNLSNTPTIPTKTSDLTNDSGFLTTEVDGSTTNELQVLSLSNDTIYLTSGGYVVLPAGFDGDYSSLTNTPTIPSKTSDLTNDSGFITAEVDGSTTNELQLLSMSNDTLYLTDGGFVVLPSGFDGDYNSLTNTPTIPSKTSDLTNDSGFITTEQDSSVTNELQTLSISNDTLFLSNGGFVKLPNSAGGTSDSNVGKVLFVSQTFSSSRTSNGSTYDTIKKINLEANILYELEMLLAASTARYTCGASSSVIVLDENHNSIPFESLEGNVHSVGNCNGPEGSSNHYNLYFTPASSGTYSFIFRFTVSGYNNYQGQGGNGGSARILLRSIISSNISNGTVSADQDSTNELQTLSISNDTLFLSNGGFVKLPNSSSTVGSSFGGGLYYRTSSHHANTNSASSVIAWGNLDGSVETSIFTNVAIPNYYSVSQQSPLRMKIIGYRNSTKVVLQAVYEIAHSESDNTIIYSGNTENEISLLSNSNTGTRNFYFIAHTYNENGIDSLRLEISQVQNNSNDQVVIKSTLKTPSVRSINSVSSNNSTTPIDYLTETGTVAGTLNPTTITSGANMSKITVPTDKVYNIRHVKLVGDGAFHKHGLKINGIVIWNNEDNNGDCDIWLGPGDELEHYYGNWGGANGSYSDSWLISIREYDK